MAETIKIKGVETAMSNTVANNYGGSRTVRITNTNGAGTSNAVLITQAMAGVNTGSFTLLGNSAVIIIKGPSDTLLCSNNNTANVFATPTGYSF
jgi:hypothetical protein